jgi:hypothetical protein
VVCRFLLAQRVGIAIGASRRFGRDGLRNSTGDDQLR